MPEPPPRRRGFVRAFFGAIVNFFVGSFLLIFFSIVFFGVLAVGSYFVIGYYIRGNEIQAPDLVSHPLIEAFDLARKNNLSLTMDREEAHSTVPEGAVVSQRPKAGAWVKERSPIRVVVSLGMRRLTLPADLVSINRREAGIRLREMGLAIGNVAFLAAPGQPEDIVLSTDPPPGTGVAPGAAVNLLVSANLSANQAIAPDLIGKTPEEAKKELTKASGLRLRVREEAKEGAASGTIHAQNPEPGALTPTGGEIEVLVAP